MSDHKEQGRNAWLWLKEKPKRFILAKGVDEMECFDVRKAKLLGTGHRQEWILLDESSALDSCQPPEIIRRYELHVNEPYS